MLGYCCELGWKTKGERGLECCTHAYICNNNASARQVKNPPAAACIKPPMYLFIFYIPNMILHLPSVCVKVRTLFIDLLGLSLQMRLNA